MVLRYNVLRNKLQAKHNTDGETARFVTQQDAGKNDEVGTDVTWDGVFFRQRCVWVFCLTRVQLYRVIVDFGRYRDGDPKGVVTAYCVPNSRCPDWIKGVARRQS